MIRDIDFNKVEDIGIAIVPSEDDNGRSLFQSYIINFKEIDLQHVMIRVRGIGVLDDKPVTTATLRILLENVKSQGFAPIDSFEKDASGLSNEYWISFRLHTYLFDKKYIFVPETIIEANFIEIPFLGRKGVMIK